MSKSTKIKVTDPEQIEMVKQISAYHKMEEWVNANPDKTVAEAEAKAVELGLNPEYLPWK